MEQYKWICTYINIYVSETAIPQIATIRYCTLKKKNPCPTFSVSRLRAAVCRISAYSCPLYPSIAFALFPCFLSQSSTKLPLKHGPNKTYFLALVKPNRVKTCLRQGTSSGGSSPAGGGGDGHGFAATKIMVGSRFLAASEARNDSPGR